MIPGLRIALHLKPRSREGPTGIGLKPPVLARLRAKGITGSKDGVRHVLSFQFAGDSSQGLPPGGQWKCMEVDGLSNVSPREGLWFTGPRETGNPQPCVYIAHTSVIL